MGDLQEIKTIENEQNKLITLKDLQPIRDIVAKGATDTELQYFASYCNQVKLNPVAKQIHFVARVNKNGERQLAFQTSIDGYRIIGERTGSYAGNDDYKFDEGLTEYEHIQTKRGNPTTASATIYRIVGGQRVPFNATARWLEYYPGERLGFMWTKMPYLMLGKCAEALALRKAFPNDLSGLYTDEEMQQSDVKVIENKKEGFLNKPISKTKVEVEVKDVSHEVIEEEVDLSRLKKKIIDSKTIKMLTMVWDMNPKFHDNVEFKEAMTKRKEELTEKILKKGGEK